MAKNSGLGRGIDVIFLDNEIEEKKNGVREIRISLIEPKADQPRKNFDGEALAQLADSIAANGVIQPILVRETTNGFYQIIAGERRWRASKMAGLKEIPAIVMEADELRAAQLALIENIQREDLNAFEEAEAYQALIGDYGLTQEEAARQLGKSRSAIANALRLLELPDAAANLLRDGEISAGHARALLGLKNRAEIPAMAERIVKRSMSVRETEAAVKSANRTSPAKPAASPAEVDYMGELERRATELSSHRITISQAPRKLVKIEYTDNADLEDILKLLCGEGIIERE